MNRLQSARITDADGDDDIPLWLLWEVLLRLPSNAVLRCKLVSKRWAFLISNPLFVPSYNYHYSSSSWTIISQKITINCPSNTLTFNEYNLPQGMPSKKHLGNLPLPKTTNSCEGYKVCGASNGLILFGLIENNYYCKSCHPCHFYFLCNPTTRESIPIPPPPPTTSERDKRHQYKFGDIFPAVVTLIENSILVSFRVVLVLPHDSPGHVRFYVYSSEAPMWTVFTASCEIPDVEFSDCPASVCGGTIYWRTRSKNGAMIAYDPYAFPDRTVVVEPPRNRPPVRGMAAYRICDGWSGKLRNFEMFVSTGSVRVKIWVLEGGEWRLSHESEDLEGGVACREALTGLCPWFFDPSSDGDVLYLRDVWRAASFDVGTKRVQAMHGFNNRTLHLSASQFFVVRTSPWPISMSRVAAMMADIVG